MKTEFSIYQVIWTMRDNKPVKDVIEEIHIKPKETLYLTKNGYWIKEEDTFSTKERLIDFLSKC